MAHFDFINAATKGYELCWINRKYFLRIAIPVLFVKLTCVLAIFTTGMQEKYLMQGIIMMPSYILEALFAIGLIRYILYKEPIFIWGTPVPPPETDTKPMPYSGVLSKEKSIKAGVAIYILVKLVEAFMLGIAMDSIPSTPVATVSDGDMDIIEFSPFISSLIIFISLVIFAWAFKLFWSFVPIAFGYPVSYYLKRLKGASQTVSMIAAWIVCSLPLMTLFSSILQGLSEGLTEGSAEFIILTSITRVVAEIMILSIQVCAMAYGIHRVLSGIKGEDEE